MATSISLHPVRPSDRSWGFLERHRVLGSLPALAFLVVFGVTTGWLKVRLGRLILDRMGGGVP